MEMEVWEGGKSECRSVIERIGVEPTQDHPACKRADFHLVSHHENT